MNDSSRSAIEIREAIPQDAELLSNLFAANSKFFFEDILRLQNLLSAFLALANKVCLIAMSTHALQQDETIVGYASIDILARPRGGKLAYLGEVLVDENYRRLGLATQLIRSSIQQASQAGCHRLILHCDPSLQSFYAALGFQNWDMGMKIENPGQFFLS